MKVYADLMNLPGISAHEYQVAAYMKNFMKNYPSFEIKVDKLGSVFAYKKSKTVNAKKVMIAGHMDEVGFIVASITSNGLIELQPIGGILPEVVVSQVLLVHTNEKGVIRGIVGSLPPHLRKAQSLDIAQFRLDVGAKSKDEALGWGIELGNMITFDTKFSLSPDKKRILAKSIDNRFGCGLALETIKEFDKKELDFDLIVGATVQEEVGLRGAETSANMFKPDLYFALDASPCTDINSSDAPSQLTGGFLVRIFDPRNIMHQGLKDYVVNLAKAKKIKYQYFTSLGGTDAAKVLDMHEGIISTTIGIPARYIHSSCAMADIFDIISAKKILFAILNDLNSEKISKLQEANR